MTDQMLRSAPTLAVFDELSKGAADSTVTLITVSENAMFLVREHGEPVAVTRVAARG